MSDHFHTDIQPCDLPSCAYDLSPLTSIGPEFLARLSEQSRLRHIIIGFPEDVNQEILNLHRCGYDVDVWSPPQRILGSAEVITVCIKRSRSAE